MKSQGVDPAYYVDADAPVRLLGDAFTIELHTVEPRIDPPPDSPHIAGVVLRARRRCSAARTGVRTWRRTAERVAHHGFCCPACRERDRSAALRAFRPRRTLNG